MLFNIYTADIIDSTKDNDIEPYSYVDDIIIACASTSLVEAVNNLQEASHKLEEWTDSNDMKIQPDKVCWMIVSLARLDRDNFTLSYAGKSVRQETEVTYLGVVIDFKLKMVKHVEKNITKARASLGPACSLCCRSKCQAQQPSEPCQSYCPKPTGVWTTCMFPYINSSVHKDGQSTE